MMDTKKQKGRQVTLASISSSLAAWALRESIKKGNKIEIPSLGIVIDTKPEDDKKTKND